MSYTIVRLLVLGQIPGTHIRLGFYAIVWITLGAALFYTSSKLVSDRRDITADDLLRRLA